MTDNTQAELREQIANVLARYDRSRLSPTGDAIDIEVEALDRLESLITAHTNAEIAKAKLEAFDVAFDCHDYDRLRAYRAELLKEVK